MKPPAASLNSPSNRSALIQELTGLDASRLSDGATEEAIGLAARAALQSVIDAGRLVLHVIWPLSGRFFALPPQALLSPFRFLVELEGQPVIERAQHIPEAVWVSGRMQPSECDLSLRCFGEAQLAVYVTDQAFNTALRSLDQILDGPAEGSDSDAVVDETIHRLLNENGGRLPLNSGAQQILALHPTRRRDEVRERIKAITKPERPGRPRNRAAG